MKETITTREDNTTAATTAPSKREATGSQTFQYLVYFVLGVLEILLVFRLVLKLMGANASNAFVDGIYGITGIFIRPFEGIFHRGLTQGIETTSVFEPATLVAIIVYAALAWGIVKLLQIASGEKQQTA